jgi:hypothetical protein
MDEENDAALTLQELQGQVQILRDAVTAATAAPPGGAPPAPPGGAPPAPPAATFALAPALAYKAAAYLDLSTTNGGKHLRPYLMALNFALTIMLSIQCEVVALVMGAMVWLIFSILRVPTVDPYVPRYKRPPLYLEQFLTFLNTSIDLTVTNLAPRIIVCRSTTTCRPFLKQSAESGRQPDHLYQAHQRFK